MTGGKENGIWTGRGLYIGVVPESRVLDLGVGRLN